MLACKHTLKQAEPSHQNAQPLLVLVLYTGADAVQYELPTGVRVGQINPPKAEKMKKAEQ